MVALGIPSIVWIGIVAIFFVIGYYIGKKRIKESIVLKIGEFLHASILAQNPLIARAVYNLYDQVLGGSVFKRFWGFRHDDNVEIIIPSELNQRTQIQDSADKDIVNLNNIDPNEEIPEEGTISIKVTPEEIRYEEDNRREMFFRDGKGKRLSVTAWKDRTDLFNEGLSEETEYLFTQVEYRTKEKDNGDKFHIFRLTEDTEYTSTQQRTSWSYKEIYAIFHIFRSLKWMFRDLNIDLCTDEEIGNKLDPSHDSNIIIMDIEGTNNVYNNIKGKDRFQFNHGRILDKVNNTYYPSEIHSNTSGYTSFTKIRNPNHPENQLIIISSTGADALYGAVTGIFPAPKEEKGKAKSNCETIIGTVDDGVGVSTIIETQKKGGNIDIPTIDPNKTYNWKP